MYFFLLIIKIMFIFIYLFIYLFGFSLSHSRIIHSYGDVTITNEELQILT